MICRCITCNYKRIDSVTAERDGHLSHDWDFSIIGEGLLDE